MTFPSETQRTIVSDNTPAFIVYLLYVAGYYTGLSALVQVLARMPAEPDLALPATLHGQPVHTVLTRMRATLDRFASPALCADLARLDGVLPELGGLTYPRIIAALGTD